MVEMDNLVEAMNKDEIWKEKIRFANTKTGIVPKSALVQSLSTIFNDSKSGLYFLDKQEKKELVFTVWEAVAATYPEIINDDELPKDWALQKAIGVNIIHRLIPTIYALIQDKNRSLGPKSQKDALDSKVWVYYFKKIKDKYTDQNDYGKKVDGVNFWKTGKEGAAGQYSSGKGRNTLLEAFTRELLKDS